MVLYIYIYILVSSVLNTVLTHCRKQTYVYLAKKKKKKRMQYLGKI